MSGYRVTSLLERGNPRGSMQMLAESRDTSQVQDAMRHLGGAGNGMKCSNYIFRLHGTKGEGWR